MSLRILVADDSSIIQKAINIGFDAYLVTISNVSNLKLAYQEMTQSNFDLLIVDSCLPSGGAAFDLQHVLSKPETPPFIVLSGSFETLKNDVRDFHGKGFSLKKPFELPTLISLVKDKLQLTLISKANANNFALLKDKKSTALGPFESYINAEMPELVQKVVHDYCDQHFKLIAKEVITSEIRRLLEAKSRHLIDN